MRTSAVSSTFGPRSCRPLAEADGNGARAGFLMMDLLLALAVMALIASLALPFVRAGGQAGLRTSAAALASLLRSSRNAALMSGQPSLVTVDPVVGVFRSSRPAGSVAVQHGVAIHIEPSGSTAVTFAGDGRSSGGTIVLTSGRARIAVSVDPLTASVGVSQR